MGVTADMSVQATVGLASEIMSHDRGGAPQEGKRGGRHPSKAQRQQMGQPFLVVLPQENERIIHFVPGTEGHQLGDRDILAQGRTPLM